MPDSTTKYFHGGRGGMRKGQMILPPSVTGSKVSNLFGSNSYDRSLVYVTTHLSAALMFAAGVKGGEVYEVQPVGGLTRDPDCKVGGMSFQCAKAKIVKRIKMNEKERQQIRNHIFGEQDDISTTTDQMDFTGNRNGDVTSPRSNDDSNDSAANDDDTA